MKRQERIDSVRNNEFLKWIKGTIAQYGYDCAKFLESVDWSKLPVHPGEFDDDADYEA